MAEYKTVYFAPDGKWFNTRQECEDYELAIEIANHICENDSQYGFHIAKRLLERYRIEERYDWEPEQPPANNEDQE